MRRKPGRDRACLFRSREDDRERVTISISLLSKRSERFRPRRRTTTTRELCPTIVQQSALARELLFLSLSAEPPGNTREISRFDRKSDIESRNHDPENFVPLCEILAPRLAEYWRGIELIAVQPSFLLFPGTYPHVKSHPGIFYRRLVCISI